MAEPTDDLAEWLLEQIAADEAEARKWVHHAQQNDLIVRDPKYLGMFMPGWHQWRDIEAFAARVLADCEAKRLLIERVGNPDWAGFRLLAQPYRDRDGYDASWDAQ